MKLLGGRFFFFFNSFVFSFETLRKYRVSVSSFQEETEHSVKKREEKKEERKTWESNLTVSRRRMNKKDESDVCLGCVCTSLTPPTERETLADTDTRTDFVCSSL